MGAKILVIGADSADPDLIERWGADGELPNLMALKRASARGRITNPTGLEAGSAWPSFHTGLNPGHQPQFDGMRRFKTDDYKFGHFSAEAAACGFWEELSRSGRRSFVLDPPYAPLDANINGVCIVDWSAHVPARGSGRLVLATSPSEIKEEVLNLVGPEPIRGLPCDDNVCDTIEDYRRFRDDHLVRIEKKAILAKHFLAKESWDYFEVVFCDLHCMGHHLWHLNDPDHPNYRVDFEAALGKPLFEGYRALDRAVGEILAQVGSDTIVLFYASHGMGPQYTGTGLLDRILYRLEHGIPASAGKRTWRAQARMLWQYVPLDIRAKLKPLRRSLSGVTRHPQFLPDRHLRKFFEVHANNGAGGVRINLKGRESQGVVSPEDYESVLEQLSSDLLSVNNAETGQPLASHVLKTHEIYAGDYLDELPDLIVFWNRSKPIRWVHSDKVGILFQEFADGRTGDHTGDGLFFAKGPGIPTGEFNRPVASVDFVPTFRQILGLPAQVSDGVTISLMVNRAPSNTTTLGSPSSSHSFPAVHKAPVSGF